MTAQNSPTALKSTTPLHGRNALVTGASRGIGRAIAVRLARDGAAVAVHYGSDREGAEQTLAEIRDADGDGYLVCTELGNEGDVDTLFEQLTPQLGTHPLDILVNNAAAPPAGPIEATTPEQFDRLFAVNVKAPYFVIQRAIPLLSDRGRVVTLSSVATRMANYSQTSFAMTKGAIEAMTMTLANELGRRGITVNAVAPGATRTATNGAIFTDSDLVEQLETMTALDRLGRGEDIADAVAFLASDDGRWVTGHVLDVSGGFHLGPRF